MTDPKILLDSISELGPAALVFLLFVGFMLITYKVFLPIVKETRETASDNREAARAARDEWKELVDRNEKFCKKVEDHYGELCDELRSKMEDQAKEIVELREENEARKAEVKTLREEIAQKDKQLEEQQEMLDDLKGQVERLRKDGEAKDREIKNLLKKIEEVEQDRDRVAKERDDLLKRVEKLEGGKAKSEK
jgi:chromosome segregation ATPase